MIPHLLRQVLLAVPALLGVMITVFLLMRSVLGDVVTSLVGLQGNVTPERLEELRRLFGLDLPLHQQFMQWLGATLQGDLGSSLRTGRPVARVPGVGFPVTLEVNLVRGLMVVVGGLPL